MIAFYNSIRAEALRRCYNIPCYSGLRLPTKNRVYTRVAAAVRRDILQAVAAGKVPAREVDPAVFFEEVEK